MNLRALLVVEVVKETRAAILLLWARVRDAPDHYWRPFTLGAGPAPGYFVSLDPDAQERLKNKLEDSLPRREDGAIPMNARAWAFKAVAG